MSDINTRYPYLKGLSRMPYRVRQKRWRRFEHDIKMQGKKIKGSHKRCTRIVMFEKWLVRMLKEGG